MVCQKCASSKVKIVQLETEGKKFAVCDDCGNIQSIGMNLKERYSKWKQYREVPAR
jgi:hypothetical protein